MNCSVSAIIPAAGIGKRFSDKEKKQFYLINGKPILYYTLKALQCSFSFLEYIIGARKEDFDFIKSVCSDLNIKNCKLVLGGKERFDTVYNCLCESSGEYVLIHDAVRPFITKQLVTNCLELAQKYSAAVCGITPRDTVKQINDGIIDKTIERDKLILTHTPQVFEKKLLQKALQYQRENSLFITDEAMAVELIGNNVYVTQSNFSNIKLTQPEDILYFKYLIENEVYKT
ncbi:2-C-methyl-D-erythritol 4-phosphate cytidylyltransferase [Deferribacteraceae bacterium V6Fe1]|nr:2-C-methyl-D-erythritol 4-phosphate cytidylyltransferase [Deferribacteraceae bacterium V6Fe1]